MGRNYSRKNDPKSSDLDLIWDSEHSDWRLSPFSAIKAMYEILSANVAESITAVWNFVSGISLTSGRIAMQELTSDILSTNGWYTIAEVETTGNESICASFALAGGGGTRRSSILFDVNFATSTTGTANLSIVIRGRSEYTGSSFGMPNVRIAKSDTVAAAGGKIQVQLSSISNNILNIQMTNNVARRSFEGFTLVSPYLDDTPTLPDGVTTGTFLEAGAELSMIDSSTRFVQSVIARRTSDDILTVECNFGQVPKQSSSISVTFPATLLRFYDGSGTFTSSSGGTYGAVVITDNQVKFTWTETNIGLGLNAGAINVFVQGAGFKITLT